MFVARKVYMTSRWLKWMHGKENIAQNSTNVYYLRIFENSEEFFEISWNSNYCQCKRFISMELLNMIL